MSLFRLPRFGASRDAVTLLLITPTRLIRADFEDRPEPVLRHLWEARAPSGESTALQAEAAYLLGPPRRCDVYVLATGISVQVLSMPVGKVNGLEGAELESALAFEAEVVSGINPFESALAAQALGADGAERPFWVAQMPITELNQIRDGLEVTKATLRGVAHPGGLLRPMGTAVAGWQRVEMWNDLVIAVDGANPSSPRANVFNGPPSRGVWQAQVDEWFGPNPVDRAVMVADSSMIQYANGPTVSLDEDPVLRGWLWQWAAELTSDRVRIPLVRPAPKPMPDAQRWTLAAGLALGAAGICATHHFVLRHQERSLERELVRVQQPAKVMAAERARADRLHTEFERLTREMVEIHDLRQFWKDTLDKEHRRHATLLAALAAATPSEVAITAIDEGSGEVHLAGLSLTSEVAGFATNVATAMEPFGWRIEPPRRRALNLAADGGPWVLDWSLRPALVPQLVRTNLPGAAGAAGPGGAIRAAVGGAAAVLGEVVVPDANPNP